MSTALGVVLGLALIAGFVVCARQVQVASTTGGKVMSGVGGAFLGITGAVLLTAVLFG